MKPLTTAEFASLVGITQSRVTAMIRSKKLPAKKYGRDWLIPATEVKRWEKIKHKTQMWLQRQNKY